MTFWSGGGGWSNVTIEIRGDGAATLIAREGRQELVVNLTKIDIERLAQAVRSVPGEGA